MGPGLGKSLSEAFSNAGSQVAMLARRREYLDKAQAEIKNSKGFVCDLGDEASIKSACALIKDEFPPISVLVVNVGASFNPGKARH